MLNEIIMTENGYKEVDKVQIAIQRIKDFEFKALQMSPDGYYVCDSGGKDSSVIKKLVEMSGVKYDVHHNLTTLDHPETVYFIHREKDRYIRGGVNYTIHYPNILLEDLVMKKKMLPTRLVRYCCEELKEHGGEGRFVILGVRRAESTKRKNSGIAETRDSRKEENLFFMNDNDDKRNFIDQCMRSKKIALNPIVDWTDDEVWEFINTYKIPMNPLYKMGFKRVGCVGCPMSTRRKQELEAMPKYKARWMRICEKLVKMYHETENHRFADADADALYKWWTQDRIKTYNIKDLLPIGDEEEE